jgi:hypothetical protein
MATEHTVFGPESQPAKLHDKMAEDAKKAAAAAPFPPRANRAPGKVVNQTAQILKRAVPAFKKT